MKIIRKSLPLLQTTRHNVMFKPGDIIKIDIKGWNLNIVGYTSLWSNLSWVKDNGKIGILISEYYHGLPFNARIKYWKIYLNNKFANATEEQFKILCDQK